jgi:hypothetical protein
MKNEKLVIPPMAFRDVSLSVNRYLTAATIGATSLVKPASAFSTGETIRLNRRPR